MRRTITTIATVIIMVSALPTLKAQNTAASSDVAETLLPVSSPEDGAVITVEGVTVTEPVLYHSGEFLKIGLNMDLTELNVKANRAVLLTPHLVVEDVDSLDLPSVSIYGRQRYYYYTRNKSMLTPDEAGYRAKEKPDSIEYVQLTGFPAWAWGQELQVHLRRTDYGCCNSVVNEWDSEIARIVRIPPYCPPIIYAQPTGTLPLKERTISGSANIEYVVDKTDVREWFHGNKDELGKIRASIDSVKDDPDISITKILLKGFASPEATWAHNVKLAKGRAASLKKYVQDLYGFDDELIETDYVPEDWAGLRRYLERPSQPDSVAHVDEILALIDKEMDPDVKEWTISTTYPEDYKYLLKTVYPKLRHTEYKVCYTIREYTELDEIMSVFETAPEKLGQNEFYLLSQQYEVGSDEFNRVFETEVKIYSEDPTANLNAANIAISRYEFDKAGEYLAKAGESPEAVYARGVYAYWTGDYDAAVDYMHKAQDAGVEAAGEVLGNIEGVDPARIEVARQNVLAEIADSAGE